jgi:hypothetical protein
MLMRIIAGAKRKGAMASRVPALAGRREAASWNWSVPRKSDTVCPNEIVTGWNDISCAAAGPPGPSTRTCLEVPRGSSIHRFPSA